MRAEEFVKEAQQWPDIESAKRAFVANPKYQHLPVSTRQAMGASAYQRQRPNAGNLVDKLKQPAVKSWHEVDENTNKSITYNGHAYMNTPRIQNLILQAQAIESQLSPVKSGMTRLWRGNRPGEVGRNPTFTNSLVGIALPFLEQYGGSLTYIDVPTGDLAKYTDRVASAPDSEFTVTPELAKTAQIVKENFADPGVETVDVEAVHRVALHEHLKSNPALYETREDFQSVREFLNSHATPAPQVGQDYVYASVQFTPIAQYINTAQFNQPHQLVKLDDQYAYFDIDGTVKRFPDSGTLTGDSLSQIYFFESINNIDHFNTLLNLKFSHYKHTTKILDKYNTNENFADGKVKGKSRPGRVKRSGASCNGSVTDLRRRAKAASGEKARMYHWCANMKSGKKKK